MKKPTTNISQRLIGILLSISLLLFVNFSLASAALKTDKNYRQTGSTVNSVVGDVDILAKQITVKSVTDTAVTDSQQKFKQSGLTVSLSAPVIDAITAVADSAETVGKSKNGRVNAMAVANTAMKGYEASQALQQFDGKNPLSGVNLSISLGSQKSKSSSHVESGQVVASAVKAGGKVNLVATGGEQSSINVIGSDIAGAKGTALSADHDINLLASTGTSTERSSNKSSGGSIGVSIGTNTGITLSANKGKGYGNGDSVTHRNSHVGSLSGKTTITAGNTLTLKGAQAVGNGIKVRAKNLHIESLQDSATYDGKQKNIGGSLTVGAGVSVGGNFSKSKINADHQAVSEQSGIFAGDEGFDVKIDKHTELKGGAITSTAKAEAAGKNRFSTGTISTSDLQNHSDYDAKGFGIGASVGLTADLGLGSKATSQGLGDKTGKNSVKVGKSVGYGSDNDSQNSITKAGIGTANITITDTVKQQTLQPSALDTETLKTTVTTESVLADKGLQNRFDKAAVQSEIDLQVTVTQDFDKTRQGVKKLFNEKLDQLKKSGASQSEIDNLQTASLIVDGIAGALSTPNSNGLVGDVAQVASPHIAKQIGDYFTGDKKDSAAHGLAHAVLGAAVAAAGGNDALTAGLSSGGSEVLAPKVAKWLYGKDNPDELTAEQKATISNITGLASTAVGATTGNVSDAVASGHAGQNAVDNNAFLPNKKIKQKDITKSGRKITSYLVENNIEDINDINNKFLSCNTDDCRNEVKKEHYENERKATALIIQAYREGVFSKEEIDEYLLNDLRILAESSDSLPKGNPISNIYGYTASDHEARSNISPTYNSVLAIVRELYPRPKDVQYEYVDQYVTSLDPSANLETISSMVEAVKKGELDSKEVQRALIAVALHKGVEIAMKPPAIKRSNPTSQKTCSFRGDMQVKTPFGYKAIANLNIGDSVYSRNPNTGEQGYNKITAHYSNPYKETVYITVTDIRGNKQKIVSNKIHPFFTKVPKGVTLPSSSEGHNYQGSIANANWVDASNLKTGYQLLSTEGAWQTVVKVKQTQEPLTAYNLTVAIDHTYFIKGLGNTDGVWVHNDCWNEGTPTGKTMPDGSPTYTMKDKSGNVVLVYKKKGDSSYYRANEYNNPDIKPYKPYPNRDGAKATKGHVYYENDSEAFEAAKKLGYTVKIPSKGDRPAGFMDPKTKKVISRDVGSNDGNGAHNGGVWKQADSVGKLGSKKTRNGTFDANMNKIGD